MFPHWQGESNLMLPLSCDSHDSEEDFRGVFIQDQFHAWPVTGTDKAGVEVLCGEVIFWSLTATLPFPRVSFLPPTESGSLLKTGYRTSKTPLVAGNVAGSLLAAQPNRVGWICKMLNFQGKNLVAGPDSNWRPSGYESKVPRVWLTSINFYYH